MVSRIITYACPHLNSINSAEGFTPQTTRGEVLLRLSVNSIGDEDVFIEYCPKYKKDNPPRCDLLRKDCPLV